jgi:citrate lyase subunit beta/citryl-CoA lyase
VLRSMLFVPGNQTSRSEKAFVVGADIVALDLEDAVAVNEKVPARSAVRSRIEGHPTSHARAFVRINAITTRFAMGDIDAVVVPGLDGIIVPKVQSAADVQIVDWLVTQWERDRNLPANRIELFPIAETASGVERLSEIARSSARIRRVAFGVADFTLDTAMEWTQANSFLFYLRGHLVVICRSAGLEAPLDCAHTDLSDEPGLRAEAREARVLGYQGKICIHPKQVRVVNEVFSPTEEEIARAKRLYAAFKTAENHGSASVQVEGRFVDYPIAERARRLLEIVGELGEDLLHRDE